MEEFIPPDFDLSVSIYSDHGGVDWEWKLDSVEQLPKAFACALE